VTGGVAWAILIPLAGAVMSALVGSRATAWVVVAATVGTVAAAGAVVWSVAMHGPVHVAVGGWGPPLGIDLHADGLAAVMLASTRQRANAGETTRSWFAHVGRRRRR
jgi:formate hydrogenlyase subunit 3/multisubunit Na+/H+ antiporter MnhD subunit